MSHLPWRVLCYKAFSTFVDDAFSLLVAMPTAHRVACLRDDAVFFVLLYQRRCYPVDLARANEYGYAYGAPAANGAPAGAGGNSPAHLAGGTPSEGLPAAELRPHTLEGRALRAQHES